MSRIPRAATWVSFALAAALASCGPGDVQEPAALAGHWEGRLTHRDATLAVDLDVEPSPTGFSARATVPALLLRDLPLADFEYRSPEVRFTLPVGGERWAFEGWFRRSVLVGTFSGGSLPRTSNRGLLPQLALKSVKARPAPYTADSVVFSGAGAALTGTLYAPADSLVHPAVALLPSPGGGTRGEWSELADRFARAGFVVLAYDARVPGGSPGAAASGTQAEDDAALALEYLRARPGVDATRVGVVGAAAGGARVPGVAARSGASFAVAISPTGGTASAWASLAAPALVLYGERDTLLRASEGAARLRAALAAGARTVTRVDVVPRADHALLLRPADGEPFDFPRAAPGGIDSLLAWSRRQTGLPPEQLPLVPPAR